MHKRRRRGKDTQWKKERLSSLPFLCQRYFTARPEQYRPSISRSDMMTQYQNTSALSMWNKLSQTRKVAAVCIIVL
ncbi:hypothetical protein BC936DRAFT_145666 [Jimgerdemannia flammicorona]|uniref:Uncharacterized protein n=2 Tax=Jimgerdemannia flammicorona TaxID=994334 RepID=A0A433Q3D6_9FUNG|nr:hypothetical protein BC936DRAFT_145666 [Jimgerdemannia flammicorona]RUS24184.1 hypothetical protein BC938DRAFT_473986 [Jimgerdemannia flammicorona]